MNNLQVNCFGHNNQFIQIFQRFLKLAIEFQNREKFEVLLKMILSQNCYNIEISFDNIPIKITNTITSLVNTFFEH